VFQDSLLFNESVRSNIAYGRPEATSEEIEAAAKAAHAHEFVSRCRRATTPSSASEVACSPRCDAAHRHRPAAS